MESNWIRTNTGYINTGWINPSNFSIYIHYKSMDSLTGYTPIFGGRTSTSSTDGIVIWRASSTTFRIDIGTNNKTINASSSGEHEITLTANNSNITFKVDDNTTNWTASVASGAFPSYLCNVNTNGSKDNHAGDYQIYSCKIWSDGTLVRDYVPATNNGNYVLRDNVNQTIYTGIDGIFSGSFNKASFWVKKEGIWKQIYQV